MSSKKNKSLNFIWPILHGSISTAMAKCGQKNCRCQTDPKALHGPYYRWTGRLNGKLTTKTVSKEIARECERRIRNYQNLQKKIEKLIKDGADSAPWTQGVQK